MKDSSGMSGVISDVHAAGNDGFELFSAVRGGNSNKTGRFSNNLARAAKAALALAACLSLSAAASCSGQKLHRYQAEFFSLFDTVTTIVGYSDSEEHFKALTDEIKGVMEEYNRLYDIYNDYEGMNNLKTVNDNAGAKPVEVDRRIIDLLLFSKEKYKETGGTVNVAMGAVLSIWHEYREAGIEDPEHAQLPPMEELVEASKHTSIDDVVIDEDKSTVFLKDPEMSLDVGAVAKGYALEQTARYLEKKGVRYVLISAGGNIRAIGGKPEGALTETPWLVGVQNPDKSSQQESIATASVVRGAMATSGTYERYYTVGGRQYHHIIDPATLYPADYVTAVTILCRDAGEADALSTAVFNMPFEKGRKFVEDLADTEALWVLKDGRVVTTSGFYTFRP